MRDARLSSRPREATLWRRAALSPRPRRAKRDYLRAPGGDLDWPCPLGSPHNRLLDPSQSPPLMHFEKPSNDPNLPTRPPNRPAGGQGKGRGKPGWKTPQEAQKSPSQRPQEASQETPGSTPKRHVSTTQARSLASPKAIIHFEEACLVEPPCVTLSPHNFH